MGMERISDFERLVQMADELAARHQDPSSGEWQASPIGWIRRLSSASDRGKVGEELVRAWARREGLTVGGRGDRGHDCVIAGLKLEVKTSLRWNNGRFVFLGLRDFDYDAVALLGLEPRACELWILPKELVWTHSYHQTLGASGAGSKWFWIRAGDPPEWLLHWGGSFSDAHNALHEVARHRVQRECQTIEQESWQELSADIAWSWQDAAKGPA